MIVLGLFWIATRFDGIVCLLCSYVDHDVGLVLLFPSSGYVSICGGYYDGLVVLYVMIVVLRGKEKNNDALFDYGDAWDCSFGFTVYLSVCFSIESPLYFSSFVFFVSLHL